MKRTVWRWTLTAFAAAWLGGCVDAPAAPPAPDPARADALVLDERGAARLSADLEPTRAGTDPDRVLALHVDGLSGALARLDGVRALDARFASGGVAVLGRDRVLRFHAPEGEPVALDEDVYGPLSVAGSIIAYVRGAPPDLELARVDVVTGVAEQLTHDMAPVWSPALDRDGALVFVSGVEGSPRLHRRDPSGRIERLPESARTPSAPTAPRLRGSILAFEDHLGVALVDLSRGALVGELAGARGLRATAQGAWVASLEGRVVPVRIPGVAR